MPAWIEVALVASQLGHTVSSQKPTSVAECTVPGRGVRKRAARGHQGGGRQDRPCDTRRGWVGMIPEEWLVMGDGGGGEAPGNQQVEELGGFGRAVTWSVEIIEG